MFVFPMTYSVDSIARRFENITAVEIAGIKADFLWDSERLIAIVLDQHIGGDERRKVLTSLEMESTKWLGEDALVVEMMLSY